jgi:hypothetical protein
MGANGNDEMVWRAALEKKGADWVARELRTRHGQPGDQLLDVVYNGPHPTREFCQRWCADQENRTVSISPTTIGIIVSVAAVLILSTMAVSSVEHQPQDRRSYPGAAPPPLQVHNPIESADPVVRRPSSSVDQGPTTSVSKPQSSCAYVTYPTADCKTSAY